MNVPGSEITGTRGGIHNSVTRTLLEAHAHDRRLRAAELRLQLLRHGRLQPRRVRDRAQDGQGRLAGRPPPQAANKEDAHENPRADRHGAEPRQVHRLPHLLGHLQERLDLARRHGVRLVQQRRDQARHRLSRRSGRTRSKWNGGWVRKANGRIEPKQGGKLGAADEDLRQSRPAARSTTTTSRSPSTTSTCTPRRRCKAAPVARPRSLITGAAHGEDRVGPELGGDPRRRVRQALARTPTSSDVEKEIYGAVREHLHDVPAAPVRALPQSRPASRPAPRARSTSARRTASC